MDLIKFVDEQLAEKKSYPKFKAGDIKLLKEQRNVYNSFKE